MELLTIIIGMIALGTGAAVMWALNNSMMKNKATAIL